MEMSRQQRILCLSAAIKPEQRYRDEKLSSLMSEM